MWIDSATTLQRELTYPALRWLRTEISDLAGEHLSFHAGNQVFFVRIFDVHDRIRVPGTFDAFLRISENWGGVSCLMPMRQLRPSKWVPASHLPGLVDYVSGSPLDITKYFLPTPPKMSQWELHDFGIQVVRHHIENAIGAEILSYQSDPAVEPAIFFAEDDGWSGVIVRTETFPRTDMNIYPAYDFNLSEIAATGIDHLYLANVTVMSADDRNKNSNDNKPFRSDPLTIDFAGLSKL
jgi:hypothetical protein